MEFDDDFVVNVLSSLNEGLPKCIQCLASVEARLELMETSSFWEKGLDHLLDPEKLELKLYVMKDIKDIMIELTHHISTTLSILFPKKRPSKRYLDAAIITYRDSLCRNYENREDCLRFVEAECKHLLTVYDLWRAKAMTIYNLSFLYDAEDIGHALLDERFDKIRNTLHTTDSLTRKVA